MSDEINVAYQLSVWTYVTVTPTLIVWMVLTYKTLGKKKEAGWLCIISLLMCASLIFGILTALFNYKFLELKAIDPVKSELYKWYCVLCQFFITTTFDLAHWFISFNYWVLSIRLKAIISKTTLDKTQFCKLRALNISVSTLTIVLAALEVIAELKKLSIFSFIIGITVIFPFMICCLILIWGIKSMIEVFKQMENHVVDNKTILLHIFAYVVLVVAWIFILFCELKNYSWRFLGILEKILLVILMVSNLILAFIVNKILNKIKQQNDEIEVDIESQSANESFNNTISSGTFEVDFTLSTRVKDLS